MPVATHCLPNGSLGTGETPVPQFPGPESTILTPAGAKRGVVVLIHGLCASFPYVLQNDSTGPTNYQTLATDLQSDGWVVIFPAVPCDNYSPFGNTGGISNDLNNDATHGARLQATFLHWWDHAVNYMNIHYPGWPVIPFGVSMGANVALNVAINRTSTISGYGVHVPAALVWTINLFGVFDQPPKLSFTLASSMNGLTLPRSTLVVNETISVQNPPTSGCLVVAAAGNFQIIRYTSWSGSTFSGVTGGDGSSTMATNGAVSQSSFTSGLDISMTGLNALGGGQQGTAPIGLISWETGDETVGYANAQTLYNNANGASAPISDIARSGGHHALDSTDVTNIMAWFQGSTSLNPDHLFPAVH